jgi:KDO2-lipid IV(A) lauroyltransferase
VELLAELVLRLLALLPRRLAQTLGGIMGRIMYALDTRAAKVTRANIQLCCSDADIDQLTQDSLRETAKTMMETPAVWFGSIDRIDRWISHVENEDLLSTAVKDDRGLLMLLPHAGNWELFNVFFRRYGQMTALYQPPRIAAMDAVMARVRARHGNEMVPTSRAGLTRLYRTLGSGGSVVVLPDQVPAGGHYIEFFGHKALTDPLSIRLAEKTGARVLGITILRSGDGRFVAHVVEPPAEIYQGGEVALVAMNRMVEQCARMAYRFGKPPGVHS